MTDKHHTSHQAKLAEFTYSKLVEILRNSRGLSGGMLPTCNRKIITSHISNGDNPLKK